MHNCIIAALLLVAAAPPAMAWERYQIGPLTVYVSPSILAVDAECKRRADAVGQQWVGSFRGCTDFAERVIISLPDSEVLLHEFCHWELQTTSHVDCPVPAERKP